VVAATSNGSGISTLQSFSTASPGGSGTTLNTGSTIIYSAGGITYSDGSLYVSDRGTSSIYRVDPTSGAASSFAYLGPNVVPTGLVFQGNSLYVADFVGINPATANGAGTVNRFTITNGTFDLASKLTVVTGLTQPAGITLVPAGLPFAGHLLISNTGYTSQFTHPFIPDGRVVKYDPFTGVNGTVNQNFIAQGSNATVADPLGLKGPAATRYLPNGDLLVADAVDTTRVRRYSSTGGSLGIFTAVNISSPSDILVVTGDTVERTTGVITTETTVWIANLNDNAGNGWISRYDLSGTFIDFRATGASYAVLAAVPEPASILGVCALAGVALRLRKRRSK